MEVRLFPDVPTLARAAAEQAITAIRQAIAARGKARVTAATGTSQIPFLEALTAAPGIDWQAVELFHLDEYVGLSLNHPASFRRYMLERLIQKTGLSTYHLLDGEGDLDRAVAQVSRAINAAPIDVAFVGIGENGHLAFNDPPADFETAAPFLVVDLDEACRRQQVGEGWFPSMDDVPRRAITMSIRQILAAQEIICIVPERRKAQVVKAALTGPVTPMMPASILQTHPRTTVYLDPASASLLPG